MDIVNKGLAKRYKREQRFRFCGLAAIVASLTFLAVLFVSIFANGYTAFKQTYDSTGHSIWIPEEIDKEDLASGQLSGIDPDLTQTDLSRM